MSSQGFQLQFWDARKRTYVPASAFETAPSALERLREMGRNTYKAWRVCGVRHALTVPPLRRKALTAGVRSVDTVQREYLQWAQSKGLKSVHVYENKLPWLLLGTRGQRYFTGACVPYVEYFTESTVEDNQS